MKKLVCISVVLWLSVGLYAQKNLTAEAEKYADLISIADLKDNLSILASDALEGRETGKRGQKMAAAFIASWFEELELTPPVAGSYYQPVELYTINTPRISVKGLKEYEEFVYYGSGQTDGEKEFALVFAGKGTDAELNKIDVKNKAVAIVMDANASLRNAPAITKIRDKGASVIFAFTTTQQEYEQLSGMLKNFANGRLSLSNKSSSSLGLFILPPVVADKFLKLSFDKLKKTTEEGKIDKVKPATVSVSIAQHFSSLKTANVLGYLEGTDKKDELLVVTSHYDHIGKKSSGEGDLINNGADDDGSGTVAVLQLAKAFAHAKKDGKGPRRSILFMTVTGEEKGLLGSDYYTQNPIFPLAGTVVNLNLDMVGRRDFQHKDSSPYIYVIGSDKLSSELHTLSEGINKKHTNLLFDYTYNDQNHPDRLYYRSDHWNFAKNNIPIIFYFDGIHEDYHLPSDEVEKIEFDLLQKRAHCVFYTAWEIANREERIMPDKK